MKKMNNIINNNNNLLILLLLCITIIEIHAAKDTEMSIRLTLIITVGGIIGGFMILIMVRHVCLDLKKPRKNNKTKDSNKINPDLEIGNNNEELEIFNYSSNNLKENLSPTALKLQETRIATITTTTTTTNNNNNNNDDDIRKNLHDKFKASVQTVAMMASTTAAMTPTHTPTTQVQSTSKDVDSNELFNDYIRSHDNNNDQIEIEEVSINTAEEIDVDDNEMTNIDGHGTKNHPQVLDHGIIIDDDDNNNNKNTNNLKSKFNNYKSKMVNNKSEETLNSIDDNNDLVDVVEEDVENDNDNINIIESPRIDNGLAGMIQDHTTPTTATTTAPTIDPFFNDWFSRHNQADISQVSSQRASRFNHALENHNFLGEDNNDNDMPTTAAFLVKKSKKKIKVSPKKVKISPKKKIDKNTTNSYNNDDNNNDDDDYEDIDDDNDNNNDNNNDDDNNNKKKKKIINSPKKGKLKLKRSKQKNIK